MRIGGTGERIVRGDRLTGLLRREPPCCVPCEVVQRLGDTRRVTIPEQQARAAFAQQKPWAEGAIHRGDRHTSRLSFDNGVTEAFDMGGAQEQIRRSQRRGHIVGPPRKGDGACKIQLLKQGLKTRAVAALAVDHQMRLRVMGAIGGHDPQRQIKALFR